MISLPSGYKRPGTVSFDLDIREFASIGFVVVQWSFLEKLLYDRSREFAERAGVPIPADAANFSFSKRIAAFRQLVEGCRLREANKKRYRSLISRIARAEGFRHKIAHGLWSYNPARPDQLWQSDRRSSEIKLEPFDAAKLAQFALSIGELSFELLDPQVRRLSNLSQSRASRSFWRSVQATPSE